VRKRWRKKRHRQFLTRVCADAVSSDAALRNRLLRSEPGTPFEIDGRYNEQVGRLMRGHGLRYWATVARRLGPSTAVVAYWAGEFPAVRDEAVFFSLADLGLSELVARRVAERSTPNQMVCCQGAILEPLDGSNGVTLLSTP
jgi:hypothetical protein